MPYTYIYICLQLRKTGLIAGLSVMFIIIIVIVIIVSIVLIRKQMK